MKSPGGVAVAVRVNAIAYSEIRDVSSNCGNRSAAVGTEDGSRLYCAVGTRSLGCIPDPKPRILKSVIAREPGYRDILDVDRFGWPGRIYHRALHSFREC